MSDSLLVLIVLAVVALIGVAFGVTLRAVPRGWGRSVWNFSVWRLWRKPVGLVLILAGAAFVVYSGPDYLFRATRGWYPFGSYPCYADDCPFIEPRAVVICGVVLVIAGAFAYRAGTKRDS